MLISAYEGNGGGVVVLRSAGDDSGEVRAPYRSERALTQSNAFILDATGRARENDKLIVSPQLFCNSARGAGRIRG